jgi:heterodisulfide reductase subunit C
MVGPLVFIVLLVAASGFFAWNISKIVRNIRLGQDVDMTDNPRARWKQMALFALGQKGMFTRPVSGILHLLVYVGFVLINIEIVEIIIDGLTGSHRIFYPYIGAAYNEFISFFEILVFAVLFGVIVFLIRRNMMNIKRFQSRELTRWPKLDANIILWAEVVLMIAILVMNGTDLALQQKGHPDYPQTGSFLISGMIAPLFSGMSTEGLVILERSAWWAHIVGIFAFLNYIPYSKHLHIFLAFPNTYFAPLEPKGKVSNMPAVSEEVKSMLFETAGSDQEPPDRFGAKDATDLSWKNIMDAYSCTECGRCSDACPANMTGKLLSPRKIMMDTRDRMEELGSQMNGDNEVPDDGKSLLGDYITNEELNACTTCNACVEACPVSINPLDIITQMRRYNSMEAANTPSQWNDMFNNVENNASPWAYPAEDRMNWADDD